MNAIKNVAHLGVLAVWTLLGLVFTASALFAHHDLMSPLGFWLWFAGFGAVTSLTVKQFDTAIGALCVHAGAFVLLNLVPTSFPFSLLRLGFDLLAGRK